MLDLTFVLLEISRAAVPIIKGIRITIPLAIPEAGIIHISLKRSPSVSAEKKRNMDDTEVKKMVTRIRGHTEY